MTVRFHSYSDIANALFGIHLCFPPSFTREHWMVLTFGFGIVALRIDFEWGKKKPPVTVPFESVIGITDSELLEQGYVRGTRAEKERG